MKTHRKLHLGSVALECVVYIREKIRVCRAQQLRQKVEAISQTVAWFTKTDTEQWVKLSQCISNLLLGRFLVFFLVSTALG
jgi:hypothetical protein